MGLENGIVVIPTTSRGKDFLESFYSPELIDDAEWKENPWNVEWDFSYWRKCWNIRSKFLQEFNDKYDEDNQEIIFTLKDIPRLIKVLKYFLNSRNWEADGNSIWEWHQCLPGIADAIHYLYVLWDKGYDDERIEDIDITIYFYDSY